MNSFGLEADDIDAIQSILATHSEIESAILYGSRATGRFRPGSDIDLCLMGKKLTDNTILEVCAEFRDSNVPYIVDVVTESDIGNENLKREIAATGRLFWKN